jgi:methionyl-tRNA formyltransferase
MNIIFFGTPAFVTPILEELHNKFIVVGIVTSPDNIEGRKKILTPSPVKQWSNDHGTSEVILTPEQFNNKTLQQLKDLKPDMFVVAAYGKILPREVLSIPKYGSVNIHPSLLPKYRGPSPIQTAILNDDEETGVTIIKMDEEVDHGPILAQWSVQISTTDTFESLHTALFQQTAAKLPAIIADYREGKITPAVQNDAEATYCLKITREDGFIDLNKPVDRSLVDRKIRAFYPWPTAWIRLDKDYGGQAKKGAILKLLPGGKIQLEGKNTVSKKDFLNGYPQSKELFERLGI